MKKINEISIEMTPEDLAKERGHLKPTDTVKLVPKAPLTSTSTTSLAEEDESIAVEKPKLKYLSNVKDTKTNKVSQPFEIDGKKYQVVRAINGKETVMGVFSHDEKDNDGTNLIHPIDEFESNIVKPIMEKEAALKQEVKIEEKPIKKQVFQSANDSLNLSQCKHYLVDQKNGKFRKFKSIQELAKAVMRPDEKYMNLKEFKRFFETKVFGGNKKTINEIEPTDSSTDVNALKVDVKKLVELIMKRFEIPFSKLDKEVEKVQFLQTMAEMMKLDIVKLPSLISNLKNIANTPAVNERVILTKNDLIESIQPKKVIKRIKVNDIK